MHHVAIHPDFRLLVLANRPGFPFLGNAFYEEVGTALASFVVPALDEASELAVVRAAAPDVDPALLRSICGAFAELRALNDAGKL